MTPKLKPGWSLGQEECKCGDAMKAEASFDADEGWGLIWYCLGCDHCGPEIEWPFVQKRASAKQLQALGFRVVTT